MGGISIECQNQAIGGGRCGGEIEPEFTVDIGDHSRIQDRIWRGGVTGSDAQIDSSSRYTFQSRTVDGTEITAGMHCLANINAWRAELDFNLRFLRVDIAAHQRWKISF